MRHHALTFTLLSTLTACNLWSNQDICANSLLTQDPQVANDCQVCGQSPCPDNSAGETGDELEPTADLTCVDGPKATARGEYCYVGHWTENTIGLDTTGYVLTHKTAADCATESNVFPCLRSTSSPDTIPANGPSQCMLCNMYDGVDGLSPEQAEALAHLPDFVFSDWLTVNFWDYGNGPRMFQVQGNPPVPRLCEAAFGESRFSGSAFHGDAASAMSSRFAWWNWQQCSTDDLSTYTPSGSLVTEGKVWLLPNSADVFGYRPNPGQGIDPQDNLTARCRSTFGIDSDAWCPTGSVCEAGWYFDGMFPYPTVCTWDDGSGTMNGIASEGSEVYGLTRWEDGIVIAGDSVKITPSMLLTLAPQEGQPFALLNDDQRVDVLGTITHCGTESLCEHLGLHVGETPLIDEINIDEILAGEVTQIEIVRPRGGSRWLTVQLAVD